MQVKVLSKAEVEAGHAEGVDAVISVRSATDIPEPELTAVLVRTTGGDPDRLLRLCFDDIGMARYGHFVGPTIAQIEDALAFGRRAVKAKKHSASPLIAIHCEHGKSRSAAIALALLADSMGEGRERDAVHALIRSDVQNRMHPNPLVVDLADHCLSRQGRLAAALIELSPAHVKWRDLWGKIIADPDAYWEKAKRVLAQRSGGEARD